MNEQNNQNIINTKETKNKIREAERQKTNLISNIIANQTKRIEHQEEIVKIERQIQEDTKQIKELERKVSIYNQTVEQFDKAYKKDMEQTVRSHEKRVKALEGDNLALEDRNKRLADTAYLQGYYMNKLVDANKAKLQGIQEKKNAQRQKFIEYIHNYLNSNFNKGDNRVLMSQAILDLHMSDRTIVRYADEISNNLVSCGYEDVLKWAQSKGRFRRRN